MVNGGTGPPVDRARVGWWAFLLVLAAVAAFIAYSFVGLLVLGLFGYYATRPIYQRLATVIRSDGVAAGLTVTVVLLPIVGLLIYAGFRVFQQAQRLLGDETQFLPLGDYLGALSTEQRATLTTAVRNPQQFLTDPEQTLQTVLEAGVQATSVVVGGLLLVSLAVTLSFFLLKSDDALSDALRQLSGGRETTAYAYASAVDEDLESVFFGNFLFVLLMAAIAAGAYWTTNVLAPAGMQVPMVVVLAFLTGVASLVPIVVGKIVYLPVVGYLAVQAATSEGSQFAFVGGVLVGYFLVLDILPQTFLQPYITGRQLDVIMMMFAYLLGPVLFGWYGFFLLPILFVLILEAVRIVLPELLHGERLTPTASMGESVGTDPSSARTGSPPADDAPGEAGADDGPATESE